MFCRNNGLSNYVFLEVSDGDVLRWTADRPYTTYFYEKATAIANSNAVDCSCQPKCRLKVQSVAYH